MTAPGATLTAPGPAMTVAEAISRYDTSRPKEWRAQPICHCRDWICAHDPKTGACRVCAVRSGGRCSGYSFLCLGEGNLE